MFVVDRAGFSETPFLAVFTVLIPLIMVVALFYTMIAVAVAAIVALMLVVAMALGAASGQVGLAATRRRQAAASPFCSWSSAPC